VDRGRGYYSPDLTAAQARLVERLATEGREAIHGRIAGLARALAELIDQTVEDAFAGAIGWIARGSGSQGGAGGEGPREQALEARLPEDALWLLRRDFDTAFIDYLEHQRQHKSLAAGDPFVDLYFRLLRFLNGLVAAQGDAFSQLVEVRTDTRALKLLCKDPSRFLGAVINRTHATLGLSATLSPPEFYRDLLGFAPGRTAHVSVPSPFPAEHRRIVIDPSVETTYRARPANYDRIAGRLSELADAVPGNCLVLFPSYGFLAAVAPFLRTASKRVLVQERGAGDRERESILEALRGALFGDVLLLAVAGGVFAEGVDYPGDMLKAVAVVGPCLPAVSLEQQLLQQYYDERFERGFEYAFVVPGMTRVIQAAGRLIRSGEDTGVIALLDRRFLRGPYRQHLPEDWVPAEGLRGVTGNPARAAAEFFATRSLPPGDRPRVTGRVASSAKKEPRS
jgi:Rad3-related DNA helicase